MKFNYKRTILCSLAFGWIALFWGSYDMFMQKIDYDVFGLSSTLHGVILAMDNVFGLLLLPLFGKLSDKHAVGRFGRRKPFVVIGTITEMIGFTGVCVFASLGKDFFAPFIVCLMITLASMAAYRSPALALVPDVNPDKFRSKANAISNIVSVVTTVLALLYFLLLMPTEKNNIHGYYAYGGAMLLTTLVLMVWFIIAVKEPKFLDDVQLEIEQETALNQSENKDKAVVLDENTENESAEIITADSTEIAADVETRGIGSTPDVDTSDSLLHLPNIDDTAYEHSMLVPTKEKLKAFRDNRFFKRACILGIVFCFYMAYNALTTNFMKYSEYVLNFSQPIIPLILAQAGAMVAFPFASWLAKKIGRRNTILIGFIVMVAGFAASFPFTEPHPVLYVLFLVLGVSFGLAMVNIYPFFLESTAEEAIGKDTGVFSVSMTFAMVVTPILSGVLIDNTGSLFGGYENAGFRVLFPYCMLFLVIAVVLTALIKSPNKLIFKRNKADKEV